MGDVAGTGLAEDAGRHGMAEDAVHAVLREADLRGYVGVGHLAMERDQVRDLELDHYLQCREIVLNLHSSSMSFLLLLVCEIDCMALPHPRMQRCMLQVQAPDPGLLAPLQSRTCEPLVSSRILPYEGDLEVRLAHGQKLA